MGLVSIFHDESHVIHFRFFFQSIVNGMTFDVFVVYVCSRRGMVRRLFWIRRLVVEPMDVKNDTNIAY